MQREAVFLLLFIVATAVAIAARRFRVPYTVALVLAGLLLGPVHAFEPPHLTKELLFSLILPGLVFEAAFHVEFRDFWRDRYAILALAVPGVVATIALTTALLTPVVGALSLADGFDWRHALVFGTIVAATDPISVVGLFKHLGVPRRLGLLIEGESLLNDGTAIALFTLALGVVAGHMNSVVDVGVAFVTIVGAGAAVGLAVGMGTSQVIRVVDDPMVEITLTTIAAYGAFLAAEHLGYSGVIATVVAGMLCGNYGARRGMSPSTRIAAETFWDYVAFALNSIVFLLIGFEVRVNALLDSWAPILAAYLAMTIGRGIVVFGVSGLLRLTRQEVTARWSSALTWGGLRGALSMVLALSLPRDFADRELVVTVTFGVVLLSILVQGLTMAPLLRLLGIVREQEARIAYDKTRGMLQAADAALAELDAMTRARAVPRDVLDTVREEYEARIRDAEATLQEARPARHEVRREELRHTRRHLLQVEKERMIEGFRSGSMSQESYEQLLADVDARLVELESRQDDEDESPARTEEPADERHRGRSPRR
jgi:CPA1 family monovalent cation:H+ antiporter